MNGEGFFVVCRHTRGGFKTWPLERVLKMNMQRLLHGAPMEEEWHPLAIESDEKIAHAREAELKHMVRSRRKELAGLGVGSVPYPTEEEENDNGAE